MRVNTGTLQKKHGGWHWRYYQGGKQLSERIGDATLTKAQAAELANKKAAALVPVAPTAADGRTPIVQFAEGVFLPWVAAEKRPATYNGYLKIWKCHLREHFGTGKLSDYQPHHATDFLTALAKDGLGHHALNHVRAVMSGIFAHALARGFVSSNPVHGAKLLVSPPKPRETPHYTLAEMIAILAALTGKARVAMALSFVGLRTAEIAGLRWEDCDLVRGLLYIRRSVWRGTIAPCKTEKSRRDIPIGATIVAILTEYQAQPNISGYVLESEAATPLDLGAYATRVIRPTLAALGLEWKGYYGGRRGCETEMAGMVNGNTQITSHYFGHSAAVADLHYRKPLPDATRAAALQLDTALGEGQQGTDAL